MKLKIRGLVFTGFAAAVFASSAMAVTPPENINDETTLANLKKTVTSQYYTDDHFQERVATADKLTEDTPGSVSEKAAFIGWNYGQGGENKEWVKLSGAVQAGDNTYVEIVHDTKSQNKTHHVQLNTDAIAGTANDVLDAGASGATNTVTKKLTTAGAVAGLLDREGSGGTTTITDQSTDNTVPTSKNVYDFVMNGAASGTGIYQPKATSAAGAQVGVKIVEGEGANQTETSTWYNLGAGQDGAAVSTAPYAKVTRDDGANGNTPGVYVDLQHSRIIGSDSINEGTGFYTSGISGDSGNRLATGIAVYQYAQPRVNTGTSVSGSVAIGYDDGTNPTTWKLLREDTAADAHKYVRLTMANDGNYDININDNETVTTKAAVLDANNNHKLVKASAVRALLGDNEIPSLPNACKSANVHCALVSVHNAGTGTQGEPGYVAPSTTLEWTVMAQAQ